MEEHLSYQELDVRAVRYLQMPSQDAFSAIRREKETGGGFAEILYLEAEIYRRDGNLDAARVAVGESLRIDPRSPLALALYAFLTEAKERRRALLTTLVGRWSSLALPRMYLGFAKLTLGDSSGAAVEFQECLRLAPDEKAARFGLIQVFLKQGDRDGAGSVAEEFVRDSDRTYLPRMTPVFLFQARRYRQAFSVARDVARKGKGWRHKLLPWVLPLAALPREWRVVLLLVVMSGFLVETVRTFAGHGSLTAWFILISLWLLLDRSFSTVLPKSMNVRRHMASVIGSSPGPAYPEYLQEALHALENRSPARPRFAPLYVERQAGPSRRRWGPIVFVALFAAAVFGLWLHADIRSHDPPPGLAKRGYIVFARTSTQYLFPVGSVLMVMRADGQGLHPLFQEAPGFADSEPAVSPDGRSVAFIRSTGTVTGDVYVVGIQGTGLRQITHGGYEEHPTWSPDGSFLAFDSVRVVPTGPNSSQQVMEISIAALQRTDIRRITVCPPPLCAEDFAPAWSPDGSEIVFVRSFDKVGVSSQQGMEALMMVGVDGKGLHSIDCIHPPHCPSNDGGPSWSPDGSEIAFTKDGVMAVIRPDGSNLTVLGSCCYNAYDPTWSPDGSLIAFSLPASQADIHHVFFASVIKVVVRDGGSHATVVFSPGGSDVEPSWGLVGARI